MTFLIAGLIGLVVPLRAADKLEDFGMDVAMHGEEAYSDGEGALLVPEEQAAASSYGARPLGSKI
jgi:Amt family ammonium transporter